MKNAIRQRCGLLVVGALIMAGTASGQGAAQQRGILLRPQPTLLQRSGGCTVGLLNLRITTGNDDLRGGNNNLDVEVHFANGDVQTAVNVNKGANWPNNSVNFASIHLNHPVAPDQIKMLRLVHSAQGGYTPPTAGQVGVTATPLGGALAPVYAAEGIKSEDNWDMTRFQAFGSVNGVDVPIASFGPNRFTGSNPSLDINVQPETGCPNPGQVTKILFTFWTADDDLRGGNDNLNVTLRFADGSTQFEPNVNHSQSWPNGSTKGAEIFLNRPMLLSQIQTITLVTTFHGGSGGDNWNMSSMQADAFLADGSHHTIAKSGFHRFSADPTGPQARQLGIRVHAIN